MGAFSRCTVEGTRNSLPLKEHGNSLLLKQHKITAVERTRNSLQLREHEILLPLKDHGGTRNSPLFTGLNAISEGTDIGRRCLNGCR
jgi:hypothetical protein